MFQLAKKHIGQNCTVRIIDEQITGIMKEVTEGGVSIETNGTVQEINMDYIITIKERPLKKKK